MLSIVFIAFGCGINWRLESMTSQPDHEASLREAIRKGLAVVVAGTGVSIAASFDATTRQSHPQASWAGLLENGLQWLKDHKLMEEDDVEAQLKLLKKNPQTHRCISAAQDIVNGMGTVKSQHFGQWLKETVGSIKAHDRSLLDALDVIRKNGNFLATTNYDGLLLGDSQGLVLTFPRFHGHLYKAERDEIGGTNDHQDPTAIYGRI